MGGELGVLVTETCVAEGGIGVVGGRIGLLVVGIGLEVEVIVGVGTISMPSFVESMVEFALMVDVGVVRTGKTRLLSCTSK